MLNRDSKILAHMARAGLFETHPHNSAPPAQVPSTPLPEQPSYFGPVKRYGHYELPVFNLALIARRTC